MTAGAVRKGDGVQQLALHEGWKRALRRRAPAVEPPPELRRPGPPERVLCAGCREKEARYGFRDEDADPTLERPRTLCFECFRMELGRREAVKARLGEGWNARQASLPLDDTLKQLARRRGRAQIAARRALGI